MVWVQCLQFSELQATTKQYQVSQFRAVTMKHINQVAGQSCSFVSAADELLENAVIQDARSTNQNATDFVDETTDVAVELVILANK